MFAEQNGNPLLTALGVDQSISTTQSGGNMEGKEVRFGAAACGLFAGATTGTSTGAVNCMHDSFTPLGGAAPMTHMMLGEISPGGVGVGLMGMLINALLAVFIAGLMVGRTPEYLGKKIQASEMKLVTLYILAMPFAVLTFAAASVLIDERGHVPSRARTACRRCSTTTPRPATTTARRSPTRAPAPSGTRPPRASRC